MKTTELAINGCYLLQAEVHRDERGCFLEQFSRTKMAKIGIDFEIAQVNQSISIPNVLRGLHFQIEPPQAKILTVLEGTLFDVLVDTRKNSPTFKKHITLTLDSENVGQSLFIPAGIAHGFYVFGERSARISYQVNTVYNPAGERGIRFDDPELAIKWPLKSRPLLSKRDLALPYLMGTI